MQARYSMRNKNKMIGIDAERNKEGLEFLKNIRRNDPRFLHQRIKDVIQAYPSQVPLNKVYELIWL